MSRRFPGELALENIVEVDIHTELLLPGSLYFQFCWEPARRAGTTTLLIVPARQATYLGWQCPILGIDLWAP